MSVHCRYQHSYIIDCSEFVNRPVKFYRSYLGYFGSISQTGASVTIIIQPFILSQRQAIHQWLILRMSLLTNMKKGLHEERLHNSSLWCLEGSRSAVVVHAALVEQEQQMCDSVQYDRFRVQRDMEVHDTAWCPSIGKS